MPPWISTCCRRTIFRFRTGTQPLLRQITTNGSVHTSLIAGMNWFVERERAISSGNQLPRGLLRSMIEAVRSGGGPPVQSVGRSGVQADKLRDRKQRSCSGHPPGWRSAACAVPAKAPNAATPVKPTRAAFLPSPMPSFWVRRELQLYDMLGVWKLLSYRT